MRSDQWEIISSQDETETSTSRVKQLYKLYNSLPRQYYLQFSVHIFLLAPVSISRTNLLNYWNQIKLMTPYGAYEFINYMC